MEDVRESVVKRLKCDSDTIQIKMARALKEDNVGTYNNLQKVLVNNVNAILEFEKQIPNSGMEVSKCKVVRAKDIKVYDDSLEMNVRVAGENDLYDGKFTFDKSSGWKIENIEKVKIVEVNTSKLTVIGVKFVEIDGTYYDKINRINTANKNEISVGLSIDNNVYTLSETGNVRIGVLCHDSIEKSNKLMIITNDEDVEITYESMVTNSSGQDDTMIKFKSNSRFKMEVPTRSEIMAFDLEKEVSELNRKLRINQDGTYGSFENIFKEYNSNNNNKAVFYTTDSIRNVGKTTFLIKMAMRNGGILVVPDKARASEIKKNNPTLTVVTNIRDGATVRFAYVDELVSDEVVEYVKNNAENYFIFKCVK